MGILQVASEKQPKEKDADADVDEYDMGKTDVPRIEVSVFVCVSVCQILEEGRI